MAASSLAMVPPIFSDHFENMRTTAEGVLPTSISVDGITQDRACQMWQNCFTLSSYSSYPPPPKQLKSRDFPRSLLGLCSVFLKAKQQRQLSAFATPSFTLIFLHYHSFPVPWTPTKGKLCLNEGKRLKNVCKSN